MSDLSESHTHIDWQPEEALRPQMLRRIEAHLAELADQAGIALSNQIRLAISQSAFAQAWADRTRYVPHYNANSLDVWFIKYADGFAFAFAATRPSLKPIAIAILFSYAPVLDRYVQRRFTKISPEDRSDIVGQCIIHALDRAHAFLPEQTQIEAWLRSRVYYKTLDFLRKHANGRLTGEAAERGFDEASERLDDIADQIEQEIDQALIPPMADLDTLLHDLPTPVAEAVRRSLNGESYDEIARAMQTTNVNTRVRVSRGRSALRKKGIAIRYHLSGLSVEEIAGEMGLPAQTVRKYISQPEAVLRRIAQWLITNALIVALFLVATVNVGAVFFGRADVAEAPDHAASPGVVEIAAATATPTPWRPRIEATAPPAPPRPAATAAAQAAAPSSTVGPARPEIAVVAERIPATQAPATAVGETALTAPAPAPSATATIAASATGTATATIAASATGTATATIAPSPTRTLVPAMAPTAAAAPAAIPSPTSAPPMSETVATATSAPSPTATSAPSPTATSAPSPTATSAPSPTATSSPSPTATSAPHCPRRPTVTPEPEEDRCDAPHDD